MEVSNKPSTKNEETEEIENHQLLLEAKPIRQTDHVALARQVWITVPIMGGSLVYGIVVGFPSTVVAQLKHSSSPILTDESTESWLASSSVLTMPIGIVINMLISRKFGRWSTLILASISFSLFWMYAFISTTTFMMISCCLLLGLTSGFQCISPTVYVAEISDPRYRGVLVTLSKSVINVGILVCHFLGSILDWWYICLLGTAIASVTTILVLFVPETPYWLLLNNRTTKASKIYLWLRNNSPTCATEFELIQQNSRRYKNESSNLTAIFSRTFFKAFFIIAISLMQLMVSFYYIFVYYSHGIFTRMIIGLDVEICIFIIDAVRLVFSLSSFVFVKMAKRRTLFIIASITLIMCQVAFVICSIYQATGHVVMIFVCMHTICGAAFLTPVVNLMLSEVFPVAVREIGNGLSVIFHFIMLFVAIKTFPAFIDGVGLTMTFGIYTFILIVCFIILYILMPETDNLSLPQIEKNLIIGATKQNKLPVPK